MTRWERDEREWLEPDRSGGFASGTVCGVRTRRYHSLLTVATTPPTGRVSLVGGIEAWVHSNGATFFLTTQRYQDGTIYPNGAARLGSFTHHPWPTWTFALEDGALLTHELVCEPESGRVVLTWRVTTKPKKDPLQLLVRPLLSVRDYHGLQRETPLFRFDASGNSGNVSWRPFDHLPAVSALSNGRYEHSPVWYRGFLYEVDRERGLDCVEDLASPGVFHMSLGGDTHTRATLIFDVGHPTDKDPEALARQLRKAERKRRQAFSNPIERAADAYLVRRGTGSTVIAGYPWFTDWGRDTFIAMRGLCLSTGRFDEAQQILLEWAEAVSEGMLPNRFPDSGGSPEYNSVDASLWFIVVVGEFLDAHEAEGRRLQNALRNQLLNAALSIVRGYKKGTRYGIRADTDGLLAAGEPGVQLTWMDAKIGDWVVTARIGKPVELQCLWINALRVAERADATLGRLRRRAHRSFLERFPREAAGLYDVVDVNHQAGENDATFRPNQIFAVGGLPLPLLRGDAARRLVDAVEDRLWTPLGLRSLDPRDRAYAGRYEGNATERDAVYHQGTVWPWLAGPFVEAWIRSRGNDSKARAAARTQFVEPLMQRLQAFGLGHLPEIADGDPPHTPRGAPFQAWSLGELIRLRRLVDHDLRNGRTSWPRNDLIQSESA